MFDVRAEPTANVNVECFQLLLLPFYENEYVLCIPSWSTPRACNHKLFIFIDVYVFNGRTVLLRKVKIITVVCDLPFVFVFDLNGKGE